MRVGFITGEYPPMQGGIADYTAILTHEMNAAGHAVFVLTNPAAAAAPRVTPTVANWNRAFFGAVNRWALANALDVVNLQYQTAAFNMAGLLHFLPRRFRHIPFITTFHDLRFPYLFPKAGALRPWVVRQLAQSSAGIIVTNRGDETTLRQYPHMPPIAQIPLGATVAPNSGGGGMSAARRADVRRRLGLDDADFVVAHFGFVNAVKGVDTLITALGLAQERGIPARLLMIGERLGASDPTNAAYAQTIDALAAHHGVSPLWTGYIDDPADYFAAADVVALPFKDGASLRRTSLQAALAYACPTITTHPTDDPLPEFTEGVHLRYVPPNDPPALAQVLAHLHTHPQERQALATGARQAAQQFRWDAIAARILAFYQQVRI